MAHDVEMMDALGVRAQHARFDREGSVTLHLAQIADMRFDREERALGGVTPGAAVPHFLEQHIDRVVEHDDVISDVHMAVIVEPFLAHALAMAVERGREIQRFASVLSGL